MKRIITTAACLLSFGAVGLAPTTAGATTTNPSYTCGVAHHVNYVPGKLVDENVPAQATACSIKTSTGYTLSVANGLFLHVTAFNVTEVVANAKGSTWTFAEQKLCVVVGIKAGATGQTACDNLVKMFSAYLPTIFTYADTNTVFPRDGVQFTFLYPSLKPFAYSFQQNNGS